MYLQNQDIPLKVWHVNIPLYNLNIFGFELYRDMFELFSNTVLRRNHLMTTPEMSEIRKPCSHLFPTCLKGWKSKLLESKGDCTSTEARL